MEAWIQRPYKSHLMVFLQLIIFLWRKQMGKEVSLLFTVTDEMPIWGLGEHEPLIIAFFLPVISCSIWRVTYKIKGSYWTSGTSIAVDLE